MAEGVEKPATGGAMMLSFGEAMRSVGAGAELLVERLQSGVSYNPLSSRTAQDPYPVYAALRARDPVHRSRLLKAWLFTRHSDVAAILSDHRHFGNDPRTGTLSSRQHAMLPPPDEFTMLLLDPPGHTRLRALVNKAFTPKAVTGLEPRIRAILGSLLDDIEDPAAVDLMPAVAQPLPVIVIAEMLGVPPEDRERFKIWSARRARLLEPMITPREREADRAGRKPNRPCLDGDGRGRHGGGRARDPRSGLALHGSGEGPHGAGPGKVVWREGSREPRPLDLAPTEARLKGHGIRLSLRYAF